MKLRTVWVHIWADIIHHSGSAYPFNVIEQHIKQGLAEICDLNCELMELESRRQVKLLSEGRRNRVGDVFRLWCFQCAKLAISNYNLMETRFREFTT